MAFDKKTKIKRSNSMKDKKFVPQQRKDKVVKIVPDDYFDNQNGDEPVILDKKELKQ